MSIVQLPCRAKDWWLDKAIYTRLGLSSSLSQWHKKALRLFSTRDENWHIRKNVILLSCHTKDLKKCRNVFFLPSPLPLVIWGDHKVTLIAFTLKFSHGLSDCQVWYFPFTPHCHQKKKKKINIPTYSTVSQDELIKEDISLFRAWKIYLFKYILLKMT